jgi:hypothetical protein
MYIIHIYLFLLLLLTYVYIYIYIVYKEAVIGMIAPNPYIFHYVL